MRSTRYIHLVGCHAEGEVGDVVVGGVTLPPSETLWDQSRALVDDTNLKDFLLNEPRGGVFRHVNILVPPKNPRADMGNIILEPETVPPMSGSNTMCVTTVLLETGILPMIEPVTNLTLEMPGGLIKVEARCENGKVTHVSFENMPSFVHEQDIEIDVQGVGKVRGDIVFGGDSFVVVSASDLGLEVTPQNAAHLRDVGMKITHAAQEQIGFSHPDLPGMDEITFCLLTDPLIGTEKNRIGRHAVAIRPGKLDRSPTGTGASARLALLHARGEVRIDEEVEFQSVLGSTFQSRIVGTTTAGGKPAIIPRITGRAWITGTHQLMLDPTDPWPTGYRLADTWPQQD